MRGDLGKGNVLALIKERLRKIFETRPKLIGSRNYHVGVKKMQNGSRGINSVENSLNLLRPDGLEI